MTEVQVDNLRNCIRAELRTNPFLTEDRVQELTDERMHRELTSRLDKVLNLLDDIDDIDRYEIQEHITDKQMELFNKAYYALFELSIQLG